jgi:murein DD-endopeptidase MepM/ murein hydrolase activator NlpD
VRDTITCAQIGAVMDRFLSAPSILGRAGAYRERVMSHGKDCAVCHEPVEIRDEDVLIKPATLHAYCSPACAHAHERRDPQPTLRREVQRRQMLSRARVALQIAVALPFVLLTSGGHSALSWQPPAPPKPDEEASERELVQLIADDVWIHPLDGPVRRMPISDGRVFGAERPGERPVECRSGHCGVDIGGEVFGEPVHAAHDGVIDRVQRGPNEDHGGLYVRISHRDGQVFSQYFHLAAIPRRIVVGLPVKAGEVVGLVGESGVKHSKAHLHFTLSVKPAGAAKEQYIDPEPLIALWPLRVPAPTKLASGVDIGAAPGIPRGAGNRRSKRVASRAKQLPRLPEPAAPGDGESD